MTDDIEFFNIKGEKIGGIIAPSFEGMTEDEIFESGAFKDPKEAKRLFQLLKKQFAELEKNVKELEKE